MSPPVFCPSCDRTYFNVRPGDRTCLRCGGELVELVDEAGPTPARNGNGNLPAPVRHSLPADTRALRTTHEELERVLADVDTEARRKVRFLVTELIAQSIRRDAGGARRSLALTLEVQERLVRVEAEGPGIPVRRENGNTVANSPDPLADLALFIVDELAMSWGSADGDEPSVWFEIERAAAPATAAT